jgi:hypothetical protein
MQLICNSLYFSLGAPTSFSFNWSTKYHSVSKSQSYQKRSAKRMSPFLYLYCVIFMPHFKKKEYMISDMGVSLCHFHMYIYYSPIWLISPHYFPSFPIPLHKITSTGFNVPCSYMTERPSTVFTLFYPLHLPSRSY